MTRRKKISKEIEKEVLVRSQRRCCLCFGLENDFDRKKGQIAHLDKDPSNNALDNLAWLCWDHHDEYDSTTSQSKGLTIEEVKEYRALLYQAVSEKRKVKWPGRKDPIRRVQIYLQGDFSSLPPDRRSEVIDALAGLLKIAPQAIELYSVYEGSVVFDLGLPLTAFHRLGSLLRANNAQLRLLGIERVILEKEPGEIEEWVVEGGRFSLVGAGVQPERLPLKLRDRIEERVRVWLDRVDWERNPFARPGSLTAAVRRAEEEKEILGRHFLWTVVRIGMPWTRGIEGYERLLDADSHSVLFAVYGEGKSACRLMVADEARKYGLLVVEYLKFDQHPRSVEEHAREIELRILQVLREQGKAFEAPEPLPHLADLINMTKKQDSKATFVLIDDVIEGLSPKSTEDEIEQVIINLFHPHLLDIPGLYFKLFLPDSLAERLSDYSVIANRKYPIDLFHMRWVKQTLRQLLREKILSVSQRGEDSFFALSDDGKGQPFDIDSVLVEKALSQPGAPRNLNVLACNLIYAHARNEPEPEKPRLTKRDLEDAILRFESETKPPTLPEEAPLPTRERDTVASILQGKIVTGDFDVFLAHNNADKPQVVAIADALKQRGLYPWLDIEQIPPGRWFQDVIQQAIPKVKSAAVIIGTKGLGRWQALELRSFISQCVEGGLPVIPVLLPGVTDLPPELLFLKELNWVHFSESIDEAEALDRLEWGITGEHPGRTLK
jgi:hypothetical protein